MTEEYNCNECGHSFAQWSSCGKREEACCPRCGSQEVERVLFLFGSLTAAELTPNDYFDAALVP